MERTGFLSINDYNPLFPYWELTKTVKKTQSRGTMSVPMSVEEVKATYIEYAVFYLSEYGVYKGDFLQNKATWQLQEGIQSPKFLERLEDTRTVVLKVEKMDCPRNIEYHGKYRVLYNDGDDLYEEAIFSTEIEAVECFKYIIDLQFNYNELGDVLGLLGFKRW
jgi:hypothetical protein